VNQNRADQGLTQGLTATAGGATRGVGETCDEANQRKFL